jgi:hypothetical protein
MKTPHKPTATEVLDQVKAAEAAMDPGERDKFRSLLLTHWGLMNAIWELKLTDIGRQVRLKEARAKANHRKRPSDPKRVAEILRLHKTGRTPGGIAKLLGGEETRDSVYKVIKRWDGKFDPDAPL